MQRNNLRKKYTENAKSIEKGLLFLKIDLKTLPEYQGPENYSARFKKCSSLENDFVISSYDGNPAVLVGQSNA